MRATVESWTDGGSPETFRDEHGNRWRYAFDDMNGTVAVERIDDYGGGPCVPGIEEHESHEVGIFKWFQVEGGEIYAAKEEEFYGVNCAEEFVVRDNSWEPNDQRSE